MKSEVLAHFPLTGLTCFALLLFLALFVGSIAWIYRKGSQKTYQHAAQLPLE